MIACKNVELMLQVVFSASSLHSLEFTNNPGTINTYTLNLLSDNSNLKKLRLAVNEFDVFEQLVAALHNNTSQTFLCVHLRMIMNLLTVYLYSLNS